MSLPPNNTLNDTYQQLVGFYDLAEELIDTVEAPKLKNALAQLDFIEPLVEQVEAATDVLTAEYRHFTEHGSVPDEKRKARIELALSSIYNVLETCDRYPEAH